MLWQWTPNVIPASVAALVSICGMAYVWPRRAAPGGRAFIAMSLAATWWVLGQAAGVLFVAPEAKLLVAQIQYVGVVLAPPLVLLFAMQHFGFGKWCGWKTFGPLFALSCTTLVLLWTNESHGWVWARSEAPVPGDVPWMVLEHGPWFRVHALAGYMMIGASVGFGFWRAVQAPKLWRQILTVAMAPLLTVLVNIAYMLGLTPFSRLDPTPIGLTLSIGLVSFAVFRFGAFELFPVAQSQILGRLDEALITLDARGSIVDLNAAARDLDAVGGKAIGRSAGDVLPEGLLGVWRAGDEQPHDVQLKTAQGDRVFEVRALRLETAGPGAASVIVLRDVTDRRLAERELEQARAQLAEANRHLEEWATTDSLTGLANRRVLDDRLAKELELSLETGEPVGLALLDLDHFKRINDVFGHDAGDEVLRAVGSCLRSAVRGEDLLARFGGEEFAVVGSSRSRRGLEILCERLRREVEGVTVLVEGNPVQVTASVGGALLDVSSRAPDGQSVREWVRAADAALYEAKRLGRNRVVVNECMFGRPGKE
jgi:diguanylate cyclase (GGDEF)-like protein